MHNAARAACCAALLCAWGDAHAQARPVRIDGIAALVGGTTPGPGVAVILHSDVELRARLALSRRGTVEVVLGALPDTLLAATLKELIGEHLIAREASRVRVSLPGAAQQAAERARIEQASGGAERLRALVAAVGARGAEIDALATRRAMVAAFLRANLEGEAVVTNAEVERAYIAQQAAFEGRPRGEALRELRAWLARQALDAAVERWVKMLGKRTLMRVHASYGDV